MRNLNGLKLIGLLGLVSGLANADLILDSVPVIDTNDIDTVTVDPLTGDVYVDTFTKDYTVTKGDANPPPAGTVTINSFSVTPTNILEGEVITLSWSSTDAVGCTGKATDNAGGWDGSAVARSYNGLRITLATEGRYSFALTCTDASGGTDTETRIVSVSTPDVPAPANCTTPVLAGGSTSWTNFWHVAFPLPGYDNERMTVVRGGYWALEFNTGNIKDHGGIISVANTSSNGTRTGSISACPGDFDVAPECTHSWGSSGGIGWATDGHPGYCQLQADTTYYLNITFTDGKDSATDTCLPTERCVATLQHINLN